MAQNKLSPVASMLVDAGRAIDSSDEHRADLELLCWNQEFGYNSPHWFDSGISEVCVEEIIAQSLIVRLGAFASVADDIQDQAQTWSEIDGRFHHSLPYAGEAWQELGLLTQIKDLGKFTYWVIEEEPGILRTQNWRWGFAEGYVLGVKWQERDY